MQEQPQNPLESFTEAEHVTSAGPPGTTLDLEIRAWQAAAELLALASERDVPKHMIDELSSDVTMLALRLEARGGEVEDVYAACEKALELSDESPEQALEALKGAATAGAERLGHLHLASHRNWAGLREGCGESFDTDAAEGDAGTTSAPGRS